MFEIADDEDLLRHIPAGSLWPAPGPRITSANFQLRHDRLETGVSVTRLSITSPERLLIQSDTADLDDHGCRKRLALLFQFIPVP
jgi:hypothetical protein